MPALVIDTSSAAVTAAVADMDGGDGAGVTVRAQRVTLNARGHGEFLAPSIQESLDEAGVRPGELTAVVAGVGPGPFTGLRVGLVTAAVFADALGIPSYGVCSLDAIGHACADERELLVVTDARRHEVYWARYRHGVRAGEPEVCRPADIDPGGLSAVAGAAAGGWNFGLRRRDVDYPPASALAALAAARHAQGAPTEVLTPLYLRRPDAVANITPKPVSQHAVAGQAVAGQAVPGDAVAGDAVAGDAVAGDAVAEEVVALEIVPMRDEHVDELMAYEHEMFGTEAWTRSAYLTELADTRNRYYVAAREGNSLAGWALVGWAGVLMAGDQAEIVTVGVVPGARRRGIARRLVAALVAEAQRRGAREAFLEVRVDNAAARQLYAGDGFAEVDIRRGYYDGGRVDAVVMRREF